MPWQGSKCVLGSKYAGILKMTGVTQGSKYVTIWLNMS